MLGHKNVAVTFRFYSHLSPEGQEDIAERMAGVLSPGIRLLSENDSEVA